MWYVSLSIALTQIFFRDLEEKKMFWIKSNKLPEKKSKECFTLREKMFNLTIPSVHTMSYEVKQEARWLHC